jgi:hypothetical protein
MSRPIDPEGVNLVFTGECPKCHQEFEFKIPPELIQKLKAAQAQHKQASQKFSSTETFVPGMVNIPTSAAQTKSQKDETYVSSKNELHVSKVLVLTITSTAETPSQRLVISQPYSVVGRKNQCGPEKQPDIEINTQDKFMSKKHCLIRKISEGSFSLEDYNSANGTKLNNRKLEKGEAVYLMDGDIITIGHTNFHVSLEKQ